MTEKNKKILVSVILAVKNEEEHIEKCLKALVNQDYPKDRYEIIIVDGMSQDRTKEIVTEFVKIYPNVKFFDNPKVIKPCGLNIGIKKAVGDIISIVDGHTRVTEDFITKAVEFLEKTGAACVGGPINTVSGGYMGKAIAYVLSSPFGVGNAKFRYSKKEGYVDTVPFGAYWKKVFDEVGLFDESRMRTEDLDLHARIRKKGGKFFMTPKIRSYYYCRSTLRGLMEQAFFNGYEVITALHAVSLRHLVPFFFLLSVVGSLILSLFFHPFIYLFVSVFWSYFALNIFFSAQVSLKNDLKYFPALILSFSTLHFSYGFGSMWGVIKLFISKNDK